MSKIPANLKYSKEHEWVKLEGDTATIGITDFAQSQLGDIVYLELPEVGADLNKDEAFGVVESIKSVSDLYAPIAGKVLETNNELTDSPENINTDSYGSWMIKIKVSSPEELSKLLSSNDYSALCN